MVGVEVFGVMFHRVLYDAGMGANREAFRKKFVEPGRLREWAEGVKQAGERIVTVNGSFDLLHAGHLHILYEGAAQGDVFMVLLNSDASIKRYKSVDRPIIALENRLQMVGAIECVDFISYFEDDDPRKVLAEIRPDVHVNGADWGEDCIEADVVRDGGGKIHIASLVEGLSTTNIIEKINALSC